VLSLGHAASERAGFAAWVRRRPPRKREPMSGKNLRSDEAHLEGELVSAVEGPGIDAVKAVTPELFVGPVAGSNSCLMSSSDSGLSPGFPISVPVESHVVRLRVYGLSIFSPTAPAAGLSGLWIQLERWDGAHAHQALGAT